MHAMARWTGRVALMLGLAVVLAGPAAAGQAFGGRGRVEAVSVTQGLVTVDDQVFRVDVHTVIQDLEGRAITLAQVPVRGAPPNTMNQTEPGAVAFEAVDGSRGPLLVTLRLIEASPQ